LRKKLVGGKEEGVGESKRVGRLKLSVLYGGLTKCDPWEKKRREESLGSSGKDRRSSRLNTGISMGGRRRRYTERQKARPGRNLLERGAGSGQAER